MTRSTRSGSGRRPSRADAVGRRSADPEVLHAAEPTQASPARPLHPVRHPGRRGRGRRPHRGLGSRSSVRSSTSTIAKEHVPRRPHDRAEEHAHLHGAAASSSASRSGLVLALMRLSPRAARTGGSRPATSSSSAACRRCWSSSRSASACRWRFPASRSRSATYGTVHPGARPRRPPPTWPRRSAPASRRCPRGRWRRPARSACPTARAMISDRHPAGVPDRPAAADQRADPALRTPRWCCILGVCRSTTYELTKFGRELA